MCHFKDLMSSSCFFLQKPCSTNNFCIPLYMFGRDLDVIVDQPCMYLRLYCCNCWCVCVCVYRDTEVGLCWSHKAVHSNAGCLEQVTLETAQQLSTFITCFPPMNHPRLLITHFIPLLPFVSLHWHPFSHLFTLSACDLYKHDYSLSSLSLLNSKPLPVFLI